MTVTVDSETLPLDELGLYTFGDVLTHIKEQNRLVTHVLIDGRPPDLENVPQLRARNLNGQTVYIETSAPQQIALEVLREIERQMDEAEISRETAIDHLAENLPNKALQKLSGCFTAWQAAQQAIKQVAQLLRVDLDRIQVGSVTLTQALANFASQLRMIRESLESRDYVSLSDILSYEIGQTVAQWRDALTQMRAIVD